MYKVLAGNLSATFNLDGGHLQRMLERGPRVIASLCEQMILHDQILVPNNDYLTAAALVVLVGEGNVIELLENNELRFVRIRKALGYAQGASEPGSLMVFGDPDDAHPINSPLEDSIARGLRAAKPWGVHNEQKLQRLLLDQSDEVDAEELLSVVRQDAIRDLQQTSLWRDEYGGKNEGEFRLPGSQPMTGQAQVTVLGPGTDTTSKPIDALLGLVLANIEIYLGQQYECVGTVTGSPIADVLEIKRRRLLHAPDTEPPITRFLELTRVPDLSRLVLKDKRNFTKLRKLSRSRHGAAFRDWFQTHANEGVEGILGAYIELLEEIQSIDKLPGKALRFLVGKVGDVALPMGPLYSIIDKFVISRLFKDSSPRFFIEGVRRLK